MAVVKYQPQLSSAYIGLVADTKPTNARVGDKFITYDTFAVYIFTPAGTWVEVASATAAVSVGI